MNCIYSYIVLIGLAIVTPHAFAITPNEVELEIGQLVENHPSQQRAEMTYDTVLNAIARSRALDMATRRYVGHTDPDGYGPNNLAALVGYDLPDWYRADLGANSIESIGGGPFGASHIFNGWMDSAGHRRHLLGESDHFVAQTHYGVGYVNVPGSEFLGYFVFISAPAPSTSSDQLAPYAEWLLTHFTAAELAAHGDLADPDNNGLSRIAEFALGMDPRDTTRLPGPTINLTTQRLEWNLPIRENLGSIQVHIEHSADLSLNTWSSDDVQKEGPVYSIPITTKGFFRLRITR